MMNILHRLRFGQSFASALVRGPATYQTNPNPPEHSKLKLLRLTLVTLWYLRVPPIVRTAFIAVLLVPYLACSAGASSSDVARTEAHGSASKSTVRRPHNVARPVSRSSASRFPKNTSRTAHGVTGHSASHRPTHYAASSRRATYSSHRGAALRRTRYTAHRRFTAQAAVPPLSRENKAESESATSTTGPPADVAPAIPDPAASYESRSFTQRTNTATPDTALPTGSDPAAAAGGNPLASPPATTPAPSGTGQIAELHLPRFPQNLHVSSNALRGTHDSLVRQNERSEQDSLERIQDDADLQDRIARGMLVRLPESTALSVNPELPDDRRYCRPWTANFLTDLSRAHNSAFHKPLVVSSAVRTVEYQKQLMRINHNAADAEGDVVSPHLTGATIDIAKSGLSRREMEWMRSELLAYQNAGLIDVEEEFRQRCFHITVYKNYSISPSSRSVTKSASTPVPPLADSSADTSPADVPPNHQ